MNKIKLTHRFARGLHLFAIAALLAGLVLSVAPPQVAYAATIAVNSTTDVIANDGQCTLREAIRAANTDTASGGATGECPAGSGADTITLPAGTYTLTITGTGEEASATGDLDITDDLTINGAGATTTIIDGGGIDRVFHIISGDATFSDVTIRNGTVADNGAGIEYGSLSLSGGETLSIQNAIIRGNTATGDDGGGVSVFSGCDSCTINITNSTFDGNSGDDGAGFYARTSSNVMVNITNSTFQDNTASEDGGALTHALYSCTINITGSTFTGNTAAGTGNSGGAIASANTNVMNITNSTFSDNTAGLHGGAISVGYGTLNLTNLTIISNTAGIDPGSWPNGNGGGINVGSSATANVKNTIVAGNTDSHGGDAPDCSGTLSSHGYNLVQDTAGCTIGGDPTGNITGQDPNLGPLQDNGGPTETHALLAGSPAIEAASCTDVSSNPVTIDQRGVSRPQPTGGNCDIGAFELEEQQPPPPPPPPPEPVGGIVVPLRKLDLVAPWMGLALLASLAALTVVLARRRKV